MQMSGFAGKGVTILYFCLRQKIFKSALQDVRCFIWKRRQTVVSSLSIPLLPACRANVLLLNLRINYLFSVADKKNIEKDANRIQNIK